MENIIITSSYSVEGYKISRYIQFVSVEVVIGTGLFSEFKASFSDFFGSRSRAFQSKLSKIKALAIQELKEKARYLNGDAVISVDLDYTNFTQNIIGLIISGTVVTLNKDNESYKIKSIDDEINLVDINSPLYIKSKKIIKHFCESKTKKLFVQFELLNPKWLDIEAIKFNLKLSTFLNESVDLENSSEIVTNFTGEAIQKIQIEINASNYDIISHIDITIEKIGFKTKELWLSSGNIINPNLSVEDLVVYQNYFGIDANCYPVENKNSWICICGNCNSTSEKKCSNCSRTKSEVFIDKEDIIQSIATKSEKKLDNSNYTNEENRYMQYYASIPNSLILELLEINKGKEIYPLIFNEAEKRNLIKNENKNHQITIKAGNVKTKIE
jgi:uncharacterized protein YbjQ (UPF0145 family)